MRKCHRQGSSVCLKQIPRMSREHIIKHIRSSLNHPQTNGQVERLNRVLKACLHLATIKQGSLPNTVQKYLEASRRTIHPSTGQPASVLHHERNHRLKLNLQGYRHGRPPPQHLRVVHSFKTMPDSIKPR